MDITHAETLVRFLARRFGTSIPKLRILSRLNDKKGIYWMFSKRIDVSPRPYMPVILHEFAHHLSHERNASLSKVRYGSLHDFVGRKSHNEVFYWNLRNVIEAAGATKIYPWDWEYHKLEKWARRDGLI